MINNKVGKEVLVPGLDYIAYEPSSLNNLDLKDLDIDLIYILVETTSLLGKLNGLISNVPDINLFVSSYVRKESLLSSQIEGTQTTLDDVLDESNENNVSLDTIDVVNYVKALEYAYSALKQEMPLCLKLIRDTHKILMDGVRGNDKNPGEFRNSQNWIGGVNSNLHNARYIPPTVSYMKDALSDLEKFINESKLPTLIKAGLAHYQFETIHPFLDGNGRIGRMLISLILLNDECLTYPLVYPSYYLKKHRDEYYFELNNVRVSGSYDSYLKFFLNAIKEATNDAINSISEILKLKEELEKVLVNETKYVKQIFNYLFKHPIVDVKSIHNDLSIPNNTIGRSLTKLIDLNILEVRTSKIRNRTYSFKPYLEILKRDTENL